MSIENYESIDRINITVNSTRNNIHTVLRNICSLYDMHKLQVHRHWAASVHNIIYVLHLFINIY